LTVRVELPGNRMYTIESGDHQLLVAVKAKK
jgi:hypothetical protein